MPAKLHTALLDARGHAAERAFIERLVHLGDERMEIWGNVDYLQGVADIDTILLQPDIGMFTIEVKGVSLDLIEEYGLKHCTITGRSGPHPIDQIGVATMDLRNYLGRFPGERPPFFIMTAAFPRITRTAFVSRFDDPQIVSHANSLIFADDLESWASLERRLRAIREVPAKGRGARNPVPNPGQVAWFTDLIKPGPVPKASRADLERGGVLRRQIGSPSPVSQKYLELGTRPPTIFRGAPGTGKTVRLQEIAVAHARAGRAVLFTCFNRALASTMRGVMASQNLGQEVHNRIVVTHVDELRRQLANDLDAFGGIFATVCVDEGQDMADDAFDFLTKLAAADAEWFIADGPGQELYGGANKTGEPPHFLAKARAEGVEETLRRNYRNSSAGYLVAQAVYEHSPNVEAIPKWVEEHPLRQNSDNPADMLDLGGIRLTAGGELPEVIRIPLPRDDWRMAKLHGYVAAFHSVLETLASEGKRRDLAILCARTTYDAQRARDALAMLGVPVHDQIDGTGRDTVVPEGHVRLVTIHSSRGIEASRVVILDFDGGVSATDAHQRNSRIMSHIALSRGQIGTTIVAFDNSTNPHLRFIEEIVKAYRADA